MAAHEQGIGEWEPPLLTNHALGHINRKAIKLLPPADHAPKLLSNKEMSHDEPEAGVTKEQINGVGGWLDEAMWNRIAGRLRLGTKGRPKAGDQDAGSRDTLAKEWEALRWLCDRGCTDDELAVLMKLKVSTVRQYLRRVTARLGCQSRTAAVAKVFRTYAQIVAADTRDSF